VKWDGSRAMGKRENEAKRSRKIRGKIKRGDRGWIFEIRI
jgi:hypothetical protein